MNVLGMTSPDLAAEIARTNAMDAAWDEAATALGKFDLAGFDRAMDKFNSLSREPGEAQAEPAQQAARSQSR